MEEKGSKDSFEKQNDSLIRRLVKHTWEIFRIIASIVIIILLMFLFFFTNESKIEKESKVESPSVLIKDLQKDVDETLEKKSGKTTNKQLLGLVNQIQKTEKTIEKDIEKNPANKVKNQELLLKVRSMKDDIILKKLLDSEVNNTEQKKDEKVKEKKTLK